MTIARDSRADRVDGARLQKLAGFAVVAAADHASAPAASATRQRYSGRRGYSGPASRPASRWRRDRCGARPVAPHLPAKVVLRRPDVPTTPQGSNLLGLADLGQDLGVVTQLRGGGGCWTGSWRTSPAGASRHASTSGARRLEELDSLQAGPRPGPPSGWSHHGIESGFRRPALLGVLVSAACSTRP